MADLYGLFTGITGEAFGGAYLRDYAHASKTFRSNQFKNAPKNKFLFHVYFEINGDAYNTSNKQFGMLVKSVKLPSYTFTTHEMNQYNRKRIVQSKIKYDPVDIAFHDDNGNMIRELWKAYYQYYYKDSKKPDVYVGTKSVNGTTTNTHFNNRSQYYPSNAVDGDVDWGYTGEPNAGDVKVPFFKTIKIFGVNRGKYVAYVLVNPIITRFGHDTYSYAEGNGLMENTMTIDYETVVYDAGQLDQKALPDIVTGFGDKSTYDHSVSPIAHHGVLNQVLNGNDDNQQYQAYQKEASLVTDVAKLAGLNIPMAPVAMILQKIDEQQILRNLFPVADSSVVETPDQQKQA